MTPDPRPTPTVPPPPTRQRPAGDRRSATSYTRYARSRVVEAQRTIDRHTTSAYTGCCLGCGRPGPCADLTEAEATMHRYHRLPFRRPGATLLDPHQVADTPDRPRFAWLGRSA